MLNAVGIDVSKGRSTVAVLQPGGIVIRKPFDVLHNREDLNELVEYIRSLDGETRAVLECTGQYHRPILQALHEGKIFVSAVNPHLIKNYGNNTIRKVKTDPADARKIARYTLDNWADLLEYSVMDSKRELLKTMNTQFDFFMKQKTAAKCNLIAVLDQTYPGVNELFDSPAREDGSQKWVDFAYSFWHVECVSKLSLNAFSERYRAFCKKHGYNYSESRAKQIHDASKQLVANLPKNKDYKDLVHTAIEQLNLESKHVEKLRKDMNDLASSLPEYPIVMSMYGVGETYGPQLMAEIGDVMRFPRREALTAFAGTDPGKNDSGKRTSKSVQASKCGSARLRKVLFQIMTTLLQNMPQDDPVYQFLDKKRSEGKPYYVYMTAGANKFLRIYYGKVKEYTKKLEEEQTKQK